MHRFRSIWLALMGGAVIVTLSLSVALGADPANDTDGNRGQTISGFVHSLIFTEDDPADDETVDEDQDEDAEDTDEETDEDLDEDTEEDADEADEVLEEDTEEENADDAARVVPAEFSNHGECVSEAANKALSGDEEADEELANHGAWVSLHARFLCWGLPDPNEEAAADEEAVLDEDADTEVTSAEARAAARAERAEAREAARAERAEAREAANAARTEVRAAGHTNRGNGGGHGKP